MNSVYLPGRVVNSHLESEADLLMQVETHKQTEK